MLFVGLPLLYSTVTTDPFVLPKELLLSAVVTVSLFAMGIKMVIDGKVSVRTTPFDKPVLLFAIVGCVSAVLAVNRFDSLIAFVPFLHAVLLYFLIVNAVKGERSLWFLLSCLVAGASISALLSVLSFFHLYVLPFAYAKTPYFNTFGNFFDEALYLAFTLPIAGYFAVLMFGDLFQGRMKGFGLGTSAETSKPGQNAKTVLFSVAFAIITAGLLVSIYQLLTSQQALILPFTDGFQIAFATISQDTGRILKSFLFGSGVGTFMTDFTRFKQASYNADANLWSITFLRSSSWVLEILSTTGILGLISFFLIGFQFMKQKAFFLPLLLAFIAAFIFPFSPVMMTLFFALLGVFGVVQTQNHAKSFNDIEVHLVTTREPVDHAESSVSSRRLSRFMPIVVFLVVAGAVSYLGYHTVNYVVSDLTFQKSLVAASQNNGAATYTLERQAITQFPYRDTYYRVFSQTNLALANALAAQTPADASPSAQTQQNVLTLIQQAIDTGRSATTVSPYSAINWNNLSGVYRSMIGFGQNADQFSVLTSQQAIVLDPNNPQQYVNLGGIYYQLQLWDDAARQFQIAISLKNDYGNAYYNLGHALEAKGDLNQAYAAYQIVKSLVTKDAANSKQISSEIDALKKKAATLQAAQQQQQEVAGAKVEPTPTPKAEATTQGPLKVNKPTTQLPERNPKAKIAGPTLSPIPSKTVTPAPTAATK